MNLMTYDFRVASVDRVAGHHANLYDHPSDEKQRSTDRAVREFLAAGVPRERSWSWAFRSTGARWRDVDPSRDGLYQPGSKPVSG